MDLSQSPKMKQYTPNFSNRPRNSANFKSPFHSSPTKVSNDQNNSSPDLKPYNFISPVKKGISNYRRGNRRYFNVGSTSNGSNYRNRGNYPSKGWRRSNENSDISIYVHPSMVVNPWVELEGLLKEKDATKSRKELNSRLEGEDSKETHCELEDTSEKSDNFYDSFEKGKDLSSGKVIEGSSIEEVKIEESISIEQNKCETNG